MFTAGQEVDLVQKELIGQTFPISVQWDCDLGSLKVRATLRNLLHNMETFLYNLFSVKRCNDVNLGGRGKST